MRSIVPQIVELERNVFEVDVGITVRFKLQELPNDMKMLAMLAGELPIGSRYFSPFANVSTYNCRELQCTFGFERTNHWHPWSYQKRIADVAKVETMKTKVEEDSNKRKKPLSEKTKRTKITDFIGNELKSRQESFPLLGEFIDKSHVEPLHLKNNAWQYFF